MSPPDLQQITQPEANAEPVPDRRHHKKKKKRKRVSEVPSLTKSSSSKSKKKVEDIELLEVPSDEKKMKKRKEKNVGESSTHEMGKEVAEEFSNDTKTYKTKRKSKRSNDKGVEDKGLDDPKTSKPRGKKAGMPRKKVSFSDKVEEFPPCEDKADNAEDGNEQDLIRGKRFTPEEDQLLKDAIDNYIQANQLGNEGLQMILKCRKYPQLKNRCWNVIAESLPWRPKLAIYDRAHAMLGRGENRKWVPRERETLMRLHEVYGGDWTLIADELGKYGKHVKDQWRFLSSKSNVNSRYWSLEEYQKLFNLVNLDLKMSVFDPKKSRRGMTRDNISWKAVGEKLVTRTFASCCVKWYGQLCSSLVRDGLWLDSDDYRMMHQLEKSDACCVEDVDWDNLLEHRSGEICRKRWDQMVRCIGGHKERSFIEQVDVLASQYCTEMIQYRKDEGCSSATPPSNGS